MILPAVINLLFPVNCVSCGNRIRLNNPYGVCGECIGKLSLTNSRSCRYCGRPVRTLEGYCTVCSAKKSQINNFYTIGYYEDIIKILISNFKYNNKRYLGRILGDLMFNIFRSRIIKDNIEVIIPVPLSSARKRERGYNQVEILARHLEKKTRIKYMGNIIKRNRDTNPQYRLTRRERFSNLQGAFSISGKLEGQAVLLIDDIATTGATLQSMASCLKKAGAGKVHALVLAHGR
ncbi:MAG: ComF family protein [Elusimicrobiota bacterium]